MIFENEINLFNPNAIANEFHTQSTQINVVQGKIGALISDSQIQELQSGGKNIYTRLVTAEADISGITTQVSSLRQADGELSSQISTIRQRADSISLEVTSVKNNYAQKAQIIMAINNITQESETVIKSSHISLAGKTIDLTSDNITINSTNFKVDKNGNITANAGTFGGDLNAAGGTFKGQLNAATGTFKGTVHVGTDIWMELTTNGSLHGGRGVYDYGYLSYAADIYDKTIKANRYGALFSTGVIQLMTPCLCTRSTTDTRQMAYIGASRTIKIITDIWQREDGGLQWTWETLQFENGLLLMA